MWRCGDVGLPRMGRKRGDRVETSDGYSTSEMCEGTTYAGILIVPLGVTAMFSGVDHFSATSGAATLSSFRRRKRQALCSTVQPDFFNWYTAQVCRCYTGEDMLG